MATNSNPQLVETDVTFTYLAVCDMSFYVVIEEAAE